MLLHPFFLASFPAERLVPRQQASTDQVVGGAERMRP